MLIYCLKCKKKTQTTDETTVVTKNERLMKRGRCAECGTMKNQFVKDSTTGGSILNKALNILPLPEMHLRSAVGSENVPNGTFNDTGKYSYCGPFTKLRQRLSEGYKGVNRLDQACLSHDIAYEKYSDTKLRNHYDDILAAESANIVTDSNTPLYERKDAQLVAALMAGKSRFGMG